MSWLVWLGQGQVCAWEKWGIGARRAEAGWEVVPGLYEPLEGSSSTKRPRAGLNHGYSTDFSLDQTLNFLQGNLCIPEHLVHRFTSLDPWCISLTFY